MSKLGNQPSRPSINGTAFKSRPSGIGIIRTGLSGDSDTSPLNVTTAGILVHTTTDYAYDEIFLWASNHDSGAASRTLTLEIGGTGTFADANKTIVVDIDKETGLVQVYPGVPHKQVSVYAKASSNNAINIFGYVDRHFRTDLSDETLGYDAGSS
jgi:hypothetical protein